MLHILIELLKCTVMLLYLLMISCFIRFICLTCLLMTLLCVTISMEEFLFWNGCESCSNWTYRLWIIARCWTSLICIFIVRFLSSTPIWLYFIVFNLIFTFFLPVIIVLGIVIFFIFIFVIVIFWSTWLCLLTIFIYFIRSLPIFNLLLINHHCISLLISSIYNTSSFRRCPHRIIIICWIKLGLQLFDLRHWLHLLGRTDEIMLLILFESLVCYIW